MSLNEGERTRLDRGDVIVKVLPSRDREVAIFSATRVNVDGDRLIAWVRRIADLKRSRHVLAIGRFSTPPQLADLIGLELDDDDLAAIRRCRVGSCDVKLSAAEIALLQQTSTTAGPDWKPAVQRAFHHLVLERARTYLSQGYAGLPPYHDRRTPVSLDRELRYLLDQSGFLAKRLPVLVEQLQSYPRTTASGLESFLYWSKESLGGKPIASVTHVTIVENQADDLPDALVAATQVFATHYMTGSLALTAVTGGREGAPRYLVYLNRSRVDVLDGLLGGLVRLIMERRLRTEASDAVHGLRTRLESGPPPG